MNDWVKIKTYDNLYLAELDKDVLNNAGIEAVIINNRDSLLLIGDIELFVKKEFKEKAENILLQFQGLTKINSFILEKPIKNFVEFLSSKGIDVILKRKEETEFVLDNYEVYVKNEDFEKVKPYLLSDELDNWVYLTACHRVRQTRFRVELLEKYGIETMVIKRKDANYHLVEIRIFVKKDDKEKAQEILQNLPQWEKVETFEKFEQAEIYEDILGQNGIRAIIKKNENNYDLFVEAENKSQAIEILNAKKNFVVLKSYQSEINALNDLDKLLANNINASIVSKDDIFLLGEYYLYVEEDQLEKALKILNKE